MAVVPKTDPLAERPTAIGTRQSHIWYAKILIEPWLSVHRAITVIADRASLMRQDAASHVRQPDLRAVSCRADCGGFVPVADHRGPPDSMTQTMCTPMVHTTRERS